MQEYRSRGSSNGMQRGDILSIASADIRGGNRHFHCSWVRYKPLRTCRISLILMCSFFIHRIYIGMYRIDFARSRNPPDGRLQ